MNQLSTEKRAQLFSCLTECMSLRATARVNDVAFNTVLKFNVEIGLACEAYQDRVFHDLPIQYVECDEIWAFVGTKEDRKRPEQPEGWGSAFTWTSIDPVSRLMPAWHVGGREYSDAYMFIQRLKYAVKEQAKNLQIVTDGNKTYLPAIEELFGDNVDYMHFLKAFYGPEIQNYSRYSMPRMKAAKRQVMIGKPDGSLSTNHIERSNLTIRNHMKRFARMATGFSKKLENLRVSVAMQMMYYNYCRIHSKLRCTPAMEIGLTDHIWTAAEVVGLMDDVSLRDANAA